MTKKEALDLFDGSASALAAALNITVPAISQWRADKIPELRALQLEKIKERG